MEGVRKVYRGLFLELGVANTDLVDVQYVTHSHVDERRADAAHSDDISTCLPN